ncbi:MULTISPECIES: hypothetical protein [Paenibacillus]|uniref:Uncharacterized protein n=2 Tax=Paenibacillus TaxID=44249 RepID=A0A1V4HHU7_9BACL|nr:MULTISPECIES: hypothetical protein [Paenibacillus]MEC0230177.1 hypothetical protein [Paenibacillus alba]NQX68247.1 hypothetical protein [Paenibacillus alba]OPH54682.1 hypothetical protein BC351_31190 [Paenibacillus ferrarius]
MPFTTGVITNTNVTGTAASNIVVNTRNIDLSNTAIITVQIFASVNSTVFHTDYATSYIVLPNAYDVREFFIAGNVAYEVQINVLNTTSAIMSVFGLDGFGNLVNDQRILQSDMSFITSLSPPM